MIIALTGHRPQKLGNEWSHNGIVSTKVKNKLIDVMQRKNPEKVITGMALGADTLWAMAAIELGIPFIAAIPFKGQESMWPQQSRNRYYTILSKAAETVIVSEGGYSAYAMQKRNIWMVDHCDLLVAVWDGTPGGTKNCYVYAKEKGTPIERINPTLL